MMMAIRIFLLGTLCLYSAGSTPTFTAEPPNIFFAVEGSNITLEWRYNFGGGSFRQLLFGNSDIHGIVDKMFLDKVPYMAPAYRGRLAANVTDTYTSITFLRVNRTDSTIYTLTITSFTKETASSKVEITVKYV